MFIQGREVTEADLDVIRRWIQDHPTSHRTQLSRELCRLWNWRDQQGRLKDMACRTMLLKLHRRGLISLPAARRPGFNHRRGQRSVDILHTCEPIQTDLASLRPIRLINVRQDKTHAPLFGCLLSRYHYLGYRTDVGECMKYLAFDRHERPLSCLLFGAAAWKARARDAWIGWDAPTRTRNLPAVTNNTRFLILPWVQAPHLASHLLGRVLRQLAADWLTVYQHPVHLVETFVDRSRFRGACYQAANWVYVGATTGRTRQDRTHAIQTPLKDHYVYPLCPDFRQRLCT